MYFTDVQFAKSQIKIRVLSFVVQAAAAVSSDPGQVILTVLSYEDGTRSPWSPFSNWPTITGGAELYRVCHLSR